ncbi:succinate--CoA ligase [ADP-forming] subunit beta, mitochondrial-like isoform X2 [Schistocerca gregaria]|nr:succinate--CoA ligase [ADP-forming] subunit beta, mitochondrial-like isoform X2 [Schistocerca gregaria]
MRKKGISLPRGAVARSPKEAVEVAKQLGGSDWVVKAQILAGGRGKGVFQNGFQGGVHIADSLEAVESISKEMLGSRLITNQTGDGGRPVDVVYVTERVYIRRETYFAITLDRSTCSPVVMVSSKGGMDIESLAKKYPSQINRIPISVETGISSEQCETIARALGFEKKLKQVAKQINLLYDLFIKEDMVLFEVNPLVETSSGDMMCLDAKLNFDPNAAFRHPEWENQKDWRQEDPREQLADKYGLNYIGLNGSIACLVNGAGLAMATMDIIKLYGGDPANFLDVGGGASVKQISEAFKLLNSDPKVTTILVNIFGGILRCDHIAIGIIQSMKEIKLEKPVILRLQGTNARKAKEILNTSDLRIIATEDLDQAASRAVKISKIKQIADEASLNVTFELPI